MSQQLRDHANQRGIERNLGQLRIELRAGTARRHLDVLVELIETLLRDCTQTVLTDCYRSELQDLKLQVSTRHNLRLVK